MNGPNEQRKQFVSRFKNTKVNLPFSEKNTSVDPQLLDLKNPNKNNVEILNTDRDRDQDRDQDQRENELPIEIKKSKELSIQNKSTMSTYKIKKKSDGGRTIKDGTKEDKTCLEEREKRLMLKKKELELARQLEDEWENKKIFVEEDTSIDYKLCEECGTRYKLTEMNLICENCGLTKIYHKISDGFSNSVNQNYNIAQNSYISINIVGPESHRFQKSLQKVCSNYGSYRGYTNKLMFETIVEAYQGSKPTKDIVSFAADLFDTIINAGNVYRKDSKKGIMAACLHYACKEIGPDRPAREIAAIMKTTESFLALGDRTLRHFNEIGLISIKTEFDPIPDYISLYLSKLGIKQKYKTFVEDLIYRAEKKKLHINNDSRTSSKCVGAIYLLIQRVPSLKHIKKSTISKECDMSVTTFNKYYKLLVSNYKIIKKIFKRHRIPMPNEWRN